MKIYSAIFYQIFPKINIESRFTSKNKDAKGSKVYNAIKSIYGETLKKEQLMALIQLMIVKKKNLTILTFKFYLFTCEQKKKRKKDQSN